DTYWFDNNDNVKNFNFSNSLFFTEGQVDQNIPIRNDCFYVVHNGNQNKYQKLYDAHRFINLQVYAHHFIKPHLIKQEECIYFDIPNKTIYMPWATDLLPHEIDAIKKTVKVNNLK